MYKLRCPQGLWSSFGIPYESIRVYVNIELESILGLLGIAGLIPVKPPPVRYWEG